MKTILVPTDFSDHALYALKAAASIARKIKAEIFLVHVYNLPSSGIETYYYIEKYYKELLTESTARLDNLAGMDFLKGLSVKKQVITDMLMWQIPTAKNFQNVDLIVMGAHGTSGFHNVFIGSNTEKVVRLADQPVLTIKKEIDDFVLRKMVFASNFEKESYSGFEKIKFFADQYKAHIDLLKVITPKDFEPTPRSEKLIHEFAGMFDLKKYAVNIYNDNTIEHGIIEFSHSVNADLISIETHGRTGFAHLINGSLAEDLVKHESRPILSIKIRNHSEYGENLIQKSSNFTNWGNE